MSAILFATIVVLLIYLLPKLYVFIVNYRRMRHYGLKIPGIPLSSLILGNAPEVPKQHDKMGQYFIDRSNEFAAKGHSVWGFWLAHVFKVMPINGKAIKDILDSTEEITKSNDYDIIVPWLGTGLLISTGEKWRTRRKMLTPMFHFKMLDGYIETFNRESLLFSQIMEKFADGKQKVDFFPFIKRCALDIICDTAMGIQLSSQLDDKNEYALAVDEMGFIATKYGMYPIYWFKPYWVCTPLYRQYNKILKTLTDFTKGVIKERQEEIVLEGTRSKMAFLDMLLGMKEANNLSDEDIREEVDTFMFEGHDTTTTGISWTLWSLATHPEIQEEVYKELEAVYGASDRYMTVEDMAQLPLLDRVLKEAMRINPPVPFVGRELKGDLQIAGYTAPKGSQILISPLLIHRNAQVYPDPLRFDPDRFLPENTHKRHAYDYIPFSAGPRNCIGQKFAVYEEKIVVSWIIRKFKISADMKFEENGNLPEIILRPQHGIPLRLVRRRQEL